MSQNMTLFFRAFKGEHGDGISLISSNSFKLKFVKFETHPSFEALIAQASLPTQSDHFCYLPLFYPSNFPHELTAHLHFLFSTFNHFIIDENFDSPNCHDLDNPLNIFLRTHGLMQYVNSQARHYSRLCYYIDFSLLSYFRLW